MAKEPLTSEQMIELEIDANLGRPSKITTPEAVAFRKEAEDFAKKVHARGGIVDLPFEIPDADDDEDEDGGEPTDNAEHDVSGEARDDGGKWTSGGGGGSGKATNTDTGKPGRVSFEVAPGTGAPGYDAYAAAPYHVRERALRAVDHVLVPEILKKVGLEGQASALAGGWMGKTNPSGQIEISKVDAETTEKMKDAAATLGLALRQDAVPVAHFHPEGDKSFVRFGKSDGGAMSRAEMSEVYDKLYSHADTDDLRSAGIGYMERDGKMVFINAGGMDEDKFHASLHKLFASLGEENHYHAATGRTNFDMVETGGFNWSADNGKGYMDRLDSRGRSDLSRWASTRAHPFIEKLFQRIDWKTGRIRHEGQADGKSAPTSNREVNWLVWNEAWVDVLRNELTGNAEHDVSDELRDDSGKWTDGGGGGTATAEHTTATVKMHPATPDDAARMKKLVLPPKWTDVHLSDDPEAPLQATGKDAKGRTQYRYSAAHSEKQAAVKFTRVREFVHELPQIRDKFMVDLDKGSHEAAVLYTIDKTGMRVGSDGDTKADKKAFGVTTLQARHVSVDGDKVKFNFIGKKGVRIKQTVKDPKLAKIMIDRLGEGQERIFDTSDSKVRDYLHSIDGPFKVKDFRTAVATETALTAMQGVKVPTNEKEFKKSRLAVAKVVAEKLGNTPSIALKAYIPPECFAKWQANLPTASA